MIGSGGSDEGNNIWLVLHWFRWLAAYSMKCPSSITYEKNLAHPTLMAMSRFTEVEELGKQAR
jgi:hypothetical protein